jgi:iron complex outermembrane receptor protein
MRARSTGSIVRLICTHALVAAAFLFAREARAGDFDLNAKVALNIPAQRLDAALLELSRQGAFQLVIESGSVPSRRAAAVSGKISVKDALDRLLSNTDLSYKWLGEHTVTIATRTDLHSSPSKLSDAFAHLRSFLSPETPPGVARAAFDVPQQGSAADRPASTPVPTQIGAGTSLEEITVTATRKEESIQNVPISISAYDQAAINEFALSSIDDLSRYTPGLNVETHNTDSTYISIRGVSSARGASTTGIYIDDTPIQIRYFGAGSSSASFYPTLFDLNRVEVLRGPQGTLFGSGSEGGTIRFVTAPPSLTEDSGHARAEIGAVKYGDASYQVGVAEGGPLIPGTLGFRVSAYTQNNAGWIDRQPWGSNVTVDKNTNWSDSATFTAALIFAPIDNLIITPAVFYQSNHVGGAQEYYGILSNPSAGNFVSGDLISSPQREWFVLPSLKVEWRLPGVTVYSNTAYIDHERDATADYSLDLVEVLTGNDKGPVTAVPAYFQNPQQSFTQEIRAQSSNPDDRLNWVVGLFYWDLWQTANEYVFAPDLQDVSIPDFGLTPVQLLGLPLLPGGLVDFNHDTTQDKQYAGFAQLDFKILNNLTLTAGARYSHSSFSYANAQGGPFNGGPTGSSGSGSESQTTPKFGLTYKPTDTLMFYTTAAKGFRPGGSNAPVELQCAPDLAKFGLTAAPAQYNSDSLWSYEIGSKGQLFAGRLQWDASAFYIKWNQIQTDISLAHCGAQFTYNVGGAVSKGFDLDLRAIPIDGLIVGTSIGYTDAKYNQTILSTATPAVPIVTNGDLLPGTPLRVVVFADYFFKRFENGAKAYVHADDANTEGYHLSNRANAEYDPVATFHPATNVLTARLGIHFVRGWDVSLFAKNLLNSQQITLNDDYQVTSNLIKYTTLTPRTIGLTVVASW